MLDPLPRPVLDPPPAPSLRILIVEDQLMISRQLDAIASQAGHVVVGATAEADRACALVRAADPDLVLLDVDLAGGGSGLDVARYAARHSDALVVFTTADGRDLPPDLHGAVGTVEKPFTRNGLSAALRFIADRGRDAAAHLQDERLQDRRLQDGGLPRRPRPEALRLSPAYDSLWG